MPAPTIATLRPALACAAWARSSGRATVARAPPAATRATSPRNSRLERRCFACHPASAARASASPVASLVFSANHATRIVRENWSNSGLRDMKLLVYATPTLRIVARGHRVSSRTSARTSLSRIRSARPLGAVVLPKEIANLDRNTPTIRAVVNNCRTCRRTRRQLVALTSPVAFFVAVRSFRKGRTVPKLDGVANVYRGPLACAARLRSVSRAWWEPLRGLVIHSMALLPELQTTAYGRASGLGFRTTAFCVRGCGRSRPGPRRICDHAASFAARHHADSRWVERPVLPSAPVGCTLKQPRLHRPVRTVDEGEGLNDPRLKARDSGSTVVY